VTANTPLYCPCGNRVGLRRSDGGFVSRQKGRIIAVNFGNASTFPPSGISVTCEDCGRTTDVDKLLDVAVA